MRTSESRQHLWALVVPILLTTLAYLVGLLLIGYLPALVASLLGR